MLGTDDYDQPIARDTVKALGFQAHGQSCAYLPDSSLTSRDKLNVRDGHYPLWGRIHFFAARSNGMLLSPAAAAFMSPFSSPVLDPVILSAIIKSGLVPPCAMKVRRVSDLGDFTYFDPPPVACGCCVRGPSRRRNLEAGVHNVRVEQRLPAEPPVVPVRLLRAGGGLAPRGNPPTWTDCSSR